MPPRPHRARPAPPAARARTRRTRSLRRAVAGAGALTFALAGCSAAGKHQAPVEAPAASGTPAAEAGLDAGLAPFYDQTLQWIRCEEFQCATATVPIDYADPAAGSIELALKRSPARSGEAVGSLLLNPGGPGGSGVDFLARATQRVSERVQESYDLVGFDPRGVGRSAPVTCVDDTAKDALLALDHDFSTDAGIAAAQAAYGEFGAACLASTGPLVGHVDTASAARDMDVLRAVLDDETLHYLGYSYGTALGATYAELFPGNAGRLVLDGAVDPSLDATEVEVQQAVGFENALRAYVQDCLGGDGCPLTGSVEDGLAQVHALVERARRSPLPTATDRALTGTLAFYGIAVTLYDDESWPVLTQALTAAIREDDGSLLLQLADIYSGRNPDGTFGTNSVEAFLAVRCLRGRSPSAPSDIRALMTELIESAPTVGQYFAYEAGTNKCAQWPVPPTEDPGPVTAEGSAPILVIGTTNDPATPYAWAEGMAEQLDSGVLLTYEGEGHTAYGRSDDCVTDAVDAYLLEGTVPAEGTRC